MGEAIQSREYGKTMNPMLLQEILKGQEVPKMTDRIRSETQNAPHSTPTGSAVGNPHDVTEASTEEEEDCKKVFLKSLGAKIKEIRTEAGESMEEFGMGIGVSASSVYKWEAGLSLIREDKLKYICSAYNVSEDWLLGKDMPKVPESQEHIQRREVLSHAMMFLSDKDLLKAQMFITDVLEQPLHIGIVKADSTEALA